MHDQTRDRAPAHYHNSAGAPRVPSGFAIVRVTELNRRQIGTLKRAGSGWTVSLPGYRMAYAWHRTLESAQAYAHFVVTVPRRPC